MDTRIARTLHGVQQRSIEHRTTEGTRRAARALARELRSGSPRSSVDIALHLVRVGERQYAYELIQASRGAIAALRPSDVEAMASGLDGWGAVDHFATYVAGPAWREGRVSDRFIQRWLESNDRWRRRAAVVATVALNCKARGGRGDARRTLTVCRAVIDDRDDMVVKAVSWALRELAKREPRSVEQFLNTNAPRIAARVRREVSNKLRTGLKTARSTESRTLSS